MLRPCHIEMHPKFAVRNSVFIESRSTSLDLSNNYCGTGILPVQYWLLWRCLFVNHICFLTNREGAKTAKEEEKREFFVGLMNLGLQCEKNLVLTTNQNNYVIYANFRKFYNSQRRFKTS